MKNAITSAVNWSLLTESAGTGSHTWRPLLARNRRRLTDENAGAGGLGNVATYAVTPGNVHSVLGFATAFGTGAISGAGVGAAAPLAAPIGRLFPRALAQVSIGGGSNVLAGKIENGENYGFFDGLWDLGMGSGISYLPPAKNPPNPTPGVADHIGVSAASQMADWSADGLKLAADSVLGDF